MSLAFRPKSFLKPSSEAELSKYLKEFGERAKIIAGGTGIYEIAHRGLLSDVEALVDISRLNLSYVESDSDNIRIGGATTMSTLLQSKQIADRKELSAILDSLKSIQPLQVKNVATVAGAICTALPFFDLPVALLSIGSRVRIGPTGETKNLSDFVKGYFSVDLDQGEFVREIEIPLGTKNRASAFQKFALTHDDWALINCGVSVSLKDKEILDSVVIFGGGVGEKPVRAKSVEKSLIGTLIDESKIRDIFDKEIPKDLEPISDIRSSAEYRLHLAKVVGRRTFLEAVGRVK